MTGIAIVLYLNQTPQQPRERDYAFAGSFYAFAIWIGLAVPGIWDGIKALLKKKAKAASNASNEQPEDKKSLAIAVVAAVLGLIIPIQMVSQTWDDHDRSGRYAARDFGMNYLSSVDENGIIFVMGDNDTFPLWYAQEVEGYRTDVKVINLSYLSTDWYASQIQHPTYEAPAVDMYSTFKDYGNGGMNYCRVKPIASNSVGLAKDAFNDMLKDKEHTFKYDYLSIPVDYNKVIKNNIVGKSQYDLIEDEILVRIGNKGALYLNQTLPLDMIAKSAENGWDRPIYFACTVPDSYYLGLDSYLQQTGMAYQVTPVKSLGKARVNLDKMYDIVMNKFRWGGLDQGKDLYLDETVRRMTSTTRGTLINLAQGFIEEGYVNGDEAAANENFNKARKVLHLMEEKLPTSVMNYENYAGIDVVKSYLNLYELTGNKDDKTRAFALCESELVRYAKFVPYLKSLNDSQLQRVIYTEKSTILHALPNFIRLYKLLGGDVDKKLKELNVTLDDVLSISSRFGENLGMLTNYIIDDKSADAVLGFFSKNRIDVRSIIPYLESQYRDLRYDDKQILNSLAKISSKYNVEDEFLRFGFSLLHDKMTKEEIIDSLITTLKMNGTSEDRANQYKDALYKQLNEYLAEE